MGQYVSRCDFVLNGEKIDDFKNFKAMAMQPREQVNLMSKTGFIKKTVRHKFTVDYVIPAANRRDFSGVEKATAMAAYEDGGTINYTGVCCLEIGEEATDGEKEVVQTITFGAEDRLDK